jgi:hypothetical protein
MYYIYQVQACCITKGSQGEKSAQRTIQSHQENAGKTNVLATIIVQGMFHFSVLLCKYSGLV